ncbi:MAG: CHASE domain-containing protein [Coriobacteriia bacterium]|nr:CHASE domain-containing protein [Coriobacteriia bacterium]
MLAKCGGDVVFGPGSYAEDDPRASRPGVAYRLPSDSLSDIFETGQEFVHGPYEDDSGTFVSAFAPVIEPRTGDVLAVVGVSVEAAEWRAALARARLVAVLIVLPLGLTVLAGVLALHRSGLPAHTRTRLPYAEVYVVAAFCAVLTLAVALALHDSEVRSRREAFGHLAQIEANEVMEAFGDLQYRKLDSLARFFEGSEFVDRDEFPLFTAPMVRRLDVQALEWVRPVPAAERAEVEAQARAEGVAGFAIWQERLDGRREPASGREIYYPIWYAEPLQGNNAALGYDVGSDPARRTALETALRSGLPSATEPIRLVQETEDEFGLLAFQPVFSGEPPAQTLRGFVLAAVRLGSFLRSVTSAGSLDDAPVAVDLDVLRAGQPPEFMASSSPAHASRHRAETSGRRAVLAGADGLAATFPVFAFDKTYAVTVHAQPSFWETYPLRAGWTTAFWGALFTVLLTASTAFLVHGRTDLERQVLARTAELCQREAYLSTLLDTLGDAVLTLEMPERRITYANRALTTIFGYSVEEAAGQTTRMLYTSEAGFTEFGREQHEALADGRERVRGELELRHKDGQTVWAEAHVTFLPGGDEPSTAISVLRDVTERRQAEERVRTQLERIAGLHEIDLAITSTFDLRLMARAVLEQTTTQLGADAAALLLFDSNTQTLEYAAVRGFRGASVERSRLRLSDGYAGRAVLERKLVGVSNLCDSEAESVRAALLAEEGFVTWHAAPLIFKGEIKGALEVFMRSERVVDEEWFDFFKTLAGQTAVAVDSAQLFESLQRSNLDLRLAYDATIEGWSRAMDLRDKETEGHTQRVAEMTERLARAMGLGEEEIVHIRRGALLHDMGKMGVPDSVLLKSDKLTDEELEIIRQHPRFAYEMLSPIAYLRPALDIPYCHHEKWDGTGYPRGLKGEEIPIAARLFAVVDVWDALRSDRPYRAAWSEEKVLEHIRSVAGTHFDSAAVEFFLRTIGG